MESWRPDARIRMQEIDKYAAHARAPHFRHFLHSKFGAQHPPETDVFAIANIIIPTMSRGVSSYPRNRVTYFSHRRLNLILLKNNELIL